MSTCSDLPADATGALLARLADGDRSVSRSLFAALWPRVRGLAGRMLPAAADADDAAQEAMVTVFARVADYDRSRPGLPWALTIGRYACLTARKARQRRREVPEEAAPALTCDDASLEVERREQAGLLAALVQGLDPRDQRALLGDDREPSVAATASLRKRRQRALGRIRAALHGTSRAFAAGLVRGSTRARRQPKRSVVTRSG
jgi:RNA polymerase sigma-70 factor (ECF subfamily)